LRKVQLGRLCETGREEGKLEHDGDSRVAILDCR
jgi:hypothetical protein